MRKTNDIRTIVLALASAGLTSLPGHSFANPSGGQVVAGNATIRQESPTKVGITQTTDKAIIDWRSFSIGANEHTQFYQPSASSVILNRVVGEDPSKILGRLTANGQVFLVNPNGIYFGKNAQIDVAALVASTHNIRNEDFLAGRYVFNIPGKPGAAVVNEGTIRVADTGIAAFLAPSVANRGVIVAKLGKVALAAANGFTLDFHGDELLTFMVADEVARTAFDVEGKPLTSFVENSGRIEAQGGYILLTAKAAENAIHGVINQSGVLEATTVGQQNGEIVLQAGRGSVVVSGTLDASATHGGNGGFIETSGGLVSIDPSTRITTAAPYGKTGRWLIDPTDYVVAASGGNITGAGLATYLASNNIEIQTVAAGAGNGDIFVNDAVTWNSANNLTLTAHRHININQHINAAGSGSIKLRADSQGTGTGTVTLGGSGRITVNAGAAVGIYYNPVSYTDAATKSDTTGNPYGSKVTRNGGSTLTAYMLVNTLGQLQTIQTRPSGKYALGRDIDAAATSSWNGGKGFIPIGNPTQTFSGLFSGDDHIVSNLYINDPTLTTAGLFGVIGANGKVVHLGLTNASVSGQEAGMLAGRNHGTISKVFAVGTVTATSAGGLTGRNWGSIDQAYSAGTVTGLRGGSAGGLTNFNAGNISNSFSTSNVTVEFQDVGGGVYQGAIGGLAAGHQGGAITNTYAIGMVTANGLPSDAAAGLFGGFGFGTTTSSYWNTQTSGQSGSGGGVGKTTAQMTQQATYSGWDFSSVWVLDVEAGFPFLAWTSRKIVGTDTVLMPTVGSMSTEQYTGATFTRGSDICTLAPVVCRLELAPVPPSAEPKFGEVAYVPSSEEDAEEVSRWSAVTTLWEDISSSATGMSKGYAEGVVAAAKGVMYLAGQVSACNGGLDNSGCTIDTEWGALRQDLKYMYDYRREIIQILRDDDFQELVKDLFIEVKGYVQKNRAYDDVGKIGGRLLMTVLSGGIGTAGNVLNVLNGYPGLAPKISPIIAQMRPFLATLPPK